MKLKSRGLGFHLLTHLNV